MGSGGGPLESRVGTWVSRADTCGGGNGGGGGGGTTVEDGLGDLVGVVFVLGVVSFLTFSFDVDFVSFTGVVGFGGTQ